MSATADNARTISAEIVKEISDLGYEIVRKDALSSQSLSLSEAREEIERLREALKPFAKAAEDCGVEDDLRIGVVKPADVIWESAVAVSITYAHVESARSALDNGPAGRASERSNYVRETFAYHIASAENGLCKVPRRVADEMLQSYKALEDRVSALADANTNPPLSDLSSLRKGAEVPCPHAPTYDAGLCCGHPDDCTLVQEGSR